MPRSTNFVPRSDDDDPASLVRGLKEFLQDQPGKAADCYVEDMTPQQCRVFALLSEGISNKEIAQRLGITTSTVKLYVSQVLKATRCANRTQAALTMFHFRYGIPLDAQSTADSATPETPVKASGQQTDVAAATVPRE